MSTWQNNPGGGFYPGQQGYPGGNPGFAQPGFAQPGFQPPPYGSGAPPPAGFVPPPVHLPPPGMYGANYNEEDGGEVKGFQFSDITIRQAFIRKVYSILMLQLLVTFGLIAIFTYHQGAKDFAAHNVSIMYICMAVTFGLLIAMACCTSVRRQAPMNYIFLLIFTIAEGLMLAFVSSQFEEQYVLLAVGITAVICFALTLFAFQTKFDFTGAGTYLLIAIVVLMIFGFITIFYHGKIVTIVYSALGALLFSMYLVYDTQLMLGGKHKYSLSPEEYIFAALNLYLDIINIFIYILSIIGASSRD